jgi:hypothetical protein
MNGNLIFILLPPLSRSELFGAYVIGAMVRASSSASASSRSRSSSCHL